MKNSTTSAAALMLTVGLAFLSLAGQSFADDSPLWGNLPPGPFGVGFRTIERFDYSRSFMPERDYYGAPLSSEPGRPVQICYWYPTPSDTGGTAMVYSEYAFPYPADARLFNMLSNLQNRELGVIFAFTRGNQAQVAQIMNYRLKGVRDAAPATGPFPLIVYHGSERGAYSQNVVLCEYLASHGFVVVTTHAVGASGFDCTDQPGDVEAAVRDKELAVGILRELPFVDFQKLGLIGYNYGITTAFIHQMRNYSVDAVATLHGHYTTEPGIRTLTASNSYSRARMGIPWLALFPDSSGQPVERGLVDSLPFSPRYIAMLPAVRAGELNVYGIMSAVSGADSTRNGAAALACEQTVADLVRQFFAASLGNDASARDWLDRGSWGTGIIVKKELPAELVPTGDQFQNIIQTHGVTRAKELADKFGFPTAENPMLPDATYTAMGYRFLQSGDTPSAVQMFAWGVAAWPNSANAWDSYGEACAASGDLEAGLAHYRRALETLPKDMVINQMMRTQLEASIPANIARLEQEIAARDAAGGNR